MSDYDVGEDEYEYDWPDQDHEDDQEENETEILMRNTFYEADENKKNNPKEAIEQYENVVMLEEQLGDEINFRFKSLENIVVLSARLSLFDKMINN